MKRSRLIYSFLAVLLFFAGTVRCVASEEKLSFRHRFGKAEADLSALDTLLSGPEASKIVAVKILSSSSPDGPYAVNSSLARSRASMAADKVRAILFAMEDGAVSTETVAEDWDGVERFLRRSRKGYKDEALRIVRETPLSEREDKLRDLWAGEAWDDLMRFCFPHLRKTQVIIVYRDEVQSQPEALLEVPASHEKVDSNSCCIYFKSGYRQVYPDYLSNGDVLAFLRSKKDDIKSLRIECWSSPEGSPSNNGLLAGFRAQCLKEYLMRELCLGSDSIETVACGEAWEGLLVEVRTSYEGSNRDALIKILSDDSMSGPQKKAAVRAMDNGNTWKVLVSSSMEKLRFARISW